MPRLALFDMDRTLVRKNTAQLYVRYQRRIGEATWRDSARVGWWMVQYTLGVLDAEAVAAKALSTVAGTRELDLAHRCDDWYLTDVEEHLCDRGRKAVQMHLAAGDVLAIVTTSSRYAAQPVAHALGIPHVVSSELEIDGEGLFTGRVVEPLCYASGKIARARKLASEVGLPLGDAIFYSDSISDLPLFAAVADRVVVNPDPRMRREAKRRGWRMEQW